MYDLAGAGSYSSSSRNITGIPEIAWSANISGVLNGFRVGDVDGDGKLEVVIIDGENLRVFNSSGAQLWNRTIHGYTFSWGARAIDCRLLADVDKDGALEILVGNIPTYGIGEIYVYKGDGTLLKTIRKTGLGDGFFRVSAASDLNHDRQIEVMAGVSANYDGNPRGVVLFNYTSGAELWFYREGTYTTIPYSAADINSDGLLEFALPGSASHNGGSGRGLGNDTLTTDDDAWLVVINQNGKEMFSRKFGDCTVWPYFVDFDKNGTWKILLVESHTSTFPGYSKLHLLDVNGSIMKTWQGPYSQAIHGTLTADLNNDGKCEVIAGFMDGKVRLLDSNLNLIMTANGSMTASAVGDINGDGDKVILAENLTSDHFMILHKNFTKLCEYNFSALGYPYDLNNDGVDEIVAIGDKLRILSAPSSSTQPPTQPPPSLPPSTPNADLTPIILMGASLAAVTGVSAFIEVRKKRRRGNASPQSLRQSPHLPRDLKMLSSLGSIARMDFDAERGVRLRVLRGQSSSEFLQFLKEDATRCTNYFDAAKGSKGTLTIVEKGEHIIFIPYEYSATQDGRRYLKHVLILSTRSELQNSRIKKIRQRIIQASSDKTLDQALSALSDLSEPETNTSH